MTVLPTEILELIIDELADDGRSLRNCASAGRPLLYRSREHLFRSIVIPCPMSRVLYNWNNGVISQHCRRLYEVLDYNHGLGGLVKSLSVTEGDLLISNDLKDAVFLTEPKRLQWIGFDSSFSKVIERMPNLTQATIDARSLRSKDDWDRWWQDAEPILRTAMVNMTHLKLLGELLYMIADDIIHIQLFNDLPKLQSIWLDDKHYFVEIERDGSEYTEKSPSDNVTKAHSLRALRKGQGGNLIEILLGFLEDPQTGLAIDGLVRLSIDIALLARILNFQSSSHNLTHVYIRVGGSSENFVLSEIDLGRFTNLRSITIEENTFGPRSKIQTAGLSILETMSPTNQISTVCVHVSDYVFHEIAYLMGLGRIVGNPALFPVLDFVKLVVTGDGGDRQLYDMGPERRTQVAISFISTAAERKISELHVEYIDGPSIVA